MTNNENRILKIIRFKEKASFYLYHCKYLQCFPVFFVDIFNAAKLKSSDFFCTFLKCKYTAIYKFETTNKYKRKKKHVCSVICSNLKI